MKNLSNKFMHLTNYSVNKKNTDYQSNGDDQICQGHKWYVGHAIHLALRIMNKTEVWT